MTTSHRLYRKVLDRRKILFFICYTLVSQIRGCVTASFAARMLCSNMRGLSDRQLAMCLSSPDAVAALGDGLRLGYEECRSQLAGRRWNCSGLGEEKVFGHHMVVGSREAAFAYAITSAGVTYALTAACARGNISSCGCLTPYRRTPQAQLFSPPSADFKWGGCSADVGYGVRFARRFLDSREVDGDARTLMNLHNNRVGRKMVRSLVRKECKCHGVSGSCALQTCWLALPSFSSVGGALAGRYERARGVAPVPGRGARTTDGHHNLQLVVSRPVRSHALSRKTPRKTELVYLERSPDYCERDLSVGSYGTSGRLCNRTSKGEDGCEVLCCGRGYNTATTVTASQCRCRFEWCCRVHCDTCVETREDHTCK